MKCSLCHSSPQEYSSQTGITLFNGTKMSLKSYLKPWGSERIHLSTQGQRNIHFFYLMAVVGNIVGKNVFENKIFLGVEVKGYVLIEGEYKCRCSSSRSGRGLPMAESRTSKHVQGLPGSPHSEGRLLTSAGPPLKGLETI